MSRAKAQYRGDGSDKNIKTVPEGLRKVLPSYCPGKAELVGEAWESHVDEFVEFILTEAQSALDELHWYAQDVMKQEIRAEYNNLLRNISSLRKKLDKRAKCYWHEQKATQEIESMLLSIKDKIQNLSINFDSLLKFEPLKCSDAITAFIDTFRKTTSAVRQKEAKKRLIECLISLEDDLGSLESEIDSFPDKPKPSEIEHEVLKEMSVRVMDVLFRNYEIELTWAYDREKDFKSTALPILKTVGDSIGLCRSEETWVNILKKVAACSDWSKSDQKS